MSSIDIIIPCYRYGRYLRECVKSVTSQTVDNLRVLILNDASPDDTDEVAQLLSKEDSRVSYVRHATNKGHIATYNEGIDWAAADFFLLLSADDYLLPGALERGISLMERYSDLAFAFGNAIETDEQGNSIKTNAVSSASEERLLKGVEFISLSGSRNIVPTPTAIIRTELQKRVGGYRSELPHAGDMEMWLRLASYGRVGFIKAPQAVYRRHSNNMSLSYLTRGWLPDLHQRKAALDYFFETRGHALQDGSQIRSKAMYLLARDAVGRASAAFNEGELELSQQLCEFAVRLTSKITMSLSWLKLMCKRGIGLKFWRALNCVWT